VNGGKVLKWRIYYGKHYCFKLFNLANYRFCRHIRYLAKCAKYGTSRKNHPDAKLVFEVVEEESDSETPIIPIKVSNRSTLKPRIGTKSAESQPVAKKRKKEKSPKKPTRRSIREKKPRSQLNYY